MSFLQSHGVAIDTAGTVAQLPSAGAAVPVVKVNAGTKRRRISSSRHAATAVDADDAVASAQQQQADYCHAVPLSLGTASAPVIDDSRTYRLVRLPGATMHVILR